MTGSVEFTGYREFNFGDALENGEAGVFSTLGEAAPSNIEFVCRFSTDKDGSLVTSFFISTISLLPLFSAFLAIVAWVKSNFRMFLLLLNS